MNKREKDKFIRSLKKASKIVASWPKWKQNLLVDSSKAMNSKPRLIIDSAKTVDK